MGQRSNYWSCSKFADWLRGTEKGGAKTGSGWRDWRRQAQSQHPVRYWIAEEVLDAIQNFIWWPVDRIYDVKYYINNRWVSRTHSLTAHPRDIQPGSWCDVGNRFLPCLFNELVDFVEVEQAWWNIAWDKEARKKYQAPFWSAGWFRWRTWRCPEAGLDALRWASELTFNDEWQEKTDPNYGQPTPQAIAAREILELYHWWTQVRPQRVDPMEASGWSAYCARQRELEDGDILASLGRDNQTPEEQAEVRRILDECYRLEELQEKEDEDMMIRLIRVRRSLWT